MLVSFSQESIVRNTVQSNLATRPVKVGVQSSLPFEGVHLILGNDLAGDKVIANAVVTEKPSLEQSPDSVEKEILCLYPASAVTRAMSKKKENSDDEITNADNVIRQVLEGASIKFSVPEPVEAFDEGSLSYKADKMSANQLILEQHKDIALTNLFARVVDKNEVSGSCMPFYKKRSTYEKVEAT